MHRGGGIRGGGCRGGENGVLRRRGRTTDAPAATSLTAPRAINSDVVVARRRGGGQSRRTVARAQPSNDLLTITFHVPST